MSCGSIENFHEGLGARVGITRFTAEYLSFKKSVWFQLSMCPPSGIFEGDAFRALRQTWLRLRIYDWQLLCENLSRKRVEDCNEYRTMPRSWYERSYRKCIIPVIEHLQANSLTKQAGLIQEELIAVVLLVSIPWDRCTLRQRKLVSKVLKGGGEGAQAMPTSPG